MSILKPVLSFFFSIVSADLSISLTRRPFGQSFFIFAKARADSRNLGCRIFLLYLWKNSPRLRPHRQKVKKLIYVYKIYTHKVSMCIWARLCTKQSGLGWMSKRNTFNPFPAFLPPPPPPPSSLHNHWKTGHKKLLLLLLLLFILTGVGIYVYVYTVATCRVAVAVEARGFFFNVAAAASASVWLSPLVSRYWHDVLFIMRASDGVAQWRATTVHTYIHTVLRCKFTPLAILLTW